MKLKLVLAAAIVTGLGLTAAIAADEPQVVRQEMMKKVGGAMGAIGAIVKGEKPFDAEVVKASLTTMAEVGKDFPNHSRPVRKSAWTPKQARRSGKTWMTSKPRPRN